MEFTYWSVRFTDQRDPTRMVPGEGVRQVIGRDDSIRPANAATGCGPEDPMRLDRRSASWIRVQLSPKERMWRTLRA